MPAQEKIRILLVDDQNMFRAGMRLLLSSQPDFEIIGEAVDGEDAIAKVNALKPQVVLMDLRMPVLDGAAATRRLKATHPQVRVLVLTTFDEDAAIFDGLRAGAIGYLLKDAPTDKLYEAIRAAARGESFLQPSVAARVVAEFARLSEQSPVAAGLAEPLSPREIQILRLLANGATNREIANQLVLAEGTVKNHVTNILTKLDVSDRTRAAIKARELGLL